MVYMLMKISISDHILGIIKVLEDKSGRNSNVKEIVNTDRLQFR